MRRGIRRQPARLIALTGLGFVFLALFASAASSQGADEYSAAVSPTTVMVGDADTFTVTLTNSGTSGSLGSANVTVNGGFTSISAGTSTTGWSADPVGNVIELRSTAGNEIGPGFAVSVDITATAPTATGTYTWDTDAKPTNDFTGATELTLIGSDPAVTVTPGDLDHFEFALINENQEAGTPFAVTATAYDEFDNVKTNYDGGATLSGNLGSAPDSTAPIYGAFGIWTSGEASASVTAFKAESGAHVTATDDSATGQSNDFTVAPGPLDHFTFANVADQVAGTAFDVTATAFDEWDNVKTNYDGGATLSGNLGTAPDSTAPTYGAFGTWTSGAATASVTAFKAESGAHVTATDDSATGQSNDFTVAPGPLDHFTIANVADQTAGTPFSVTATAFDEWDNVKTNYGGGATLSGNLSNSTRGCGTGDASPCSPSYGAFGTWTAGVATASATAFKAESARTVTVTDTTPNPDVSADSNVFDVAPNVATAPPTRFSLQPTLTERNQTINDTTGVQVTVEDFWGNPRSGDSVTVAIGTNPSGGALSGTLTQTTNTSGVATFADLSINNSGLGYTLTATTGSALTTSSAFDVANDVNECSGTCSATGTTPATSAKVDGFGLSGSLSSQLGPVTAAQQGSARIGMTVAESVDVPGGVCGGTGGGPFVQLGDGFGVSTVRGSGNTPSFKIEAKLAKQFVGKRSPGSFNICLGAFNVTNPPAAPEPSECTNATTSESWRTKNGTCAVLNGGYFWGLVADYPKTVKDCPKTAPSNLFPGILSRLKNGAGELVITLCVPYPWDEKGGFG